MKTLPENYPHKEWFKQLFRHSTSYGNQELIAFNDQYSLLRIKHRGVYNRVSQRVNGSLTEWILAANGQIDKMTYPVKAWNKDGRLLKSDKEMIKEKYGLSVGEN